jgi:outer membrane lipoprotein-sorting protein|tara:strand:- start:2791 stop:3111 length:321 start_codon:yes stop_codon:yes gene_type:complete
MILAQQLGKIGDENAEHIEVVLSNGDRVWIYDDNDGYGSIELIRYDDAEKSRVTSSTKRDSVLSRKKKFNNTMFKSRTIEISSKWDHVEKTNKRTVVHLKQFYPRQ